MIQSHSFRHGSITGIWRAILARMQQSPFIHWLEQQPAKWMLVAGIALGIGVGTVALFGVGGIGGVVLCLPVLGVAFLLSAGAQPVLWEAVRTPSVVKDIPALPEMVELPGGTFLMGSPESDDQVWSDEKPQHKVTVSGFAMSRYPITRRQYREVMKETPSEWRKGQDDDRLPANYVDWFDAVKFCNALSEQQGLQPCYRIEGKRVEWDREANGYRLPTEAEWEYAVRAGTTTWWFCGNWSYKLKRYAWFDKNAGGRIHPVGEKEPNPWGLYDLAGNVYEWCWDWHQTYSAEACADPVGPPAGDYRVRRGGAYWDDALYLRSAIRACNVPEFRDTGVGFRCVRTLGAPASPPAR